MNSKVTPGLSPLAILFVALALSIGWGVRGNWGHEYGAMIPGALAAMAAVIVSGRDDWHRRVGFFAFYGAVGWSFGGSISYMQVIAYTHSGEHEYGTVLYGFACLFLIGFIWAAIGGAGTAVSAFLNRGRLTEMLIPVLAVFVAWIAQDEFFRFYLGHLHDQVNSGSLTNEQFREQIAWINWFDTDWIAVLVAATATVLLAIVRRRVCWGTSLILHMCAGWWIGFTLLTDCLGLHMTPPRGDNWSGALGMTVALLVYLARQREWGIAWAALLSGLFGGLGFSGATLIKLMLIHPQVQDRLFGGPIESNWHSILEQSFGFISGIGIALAMGYLSTRAPRQTESPEVRRWAEPATVFFLLLVVTYVNIVKNLEAVWLKNGTLPDAMWGYSTEYWFYGAYAALAVAIGWPLVAWYRGRELDVLPGTRLGKAQLLFITFLWWIVIGNLARTVPFQPQRLITEGVIHVNACLCTLLALLLPCRQRVAGERAEPNFFTAVKSMLATIMLVTAIALAAEYSLVRSLWGDTFAGHAGKHIRFGPNATLDKK